MMRSRPGIWVVLDKFCKEAYSYFGKWKEIFPTRYGASLKKPNGMCKDKLGMFTL
jgi:hypothetical protein